MFNKVIGIPMHRQLKELIQEQVISGALPPHTQLPSERELCEKYGISRTTVRRAMAELLSEGLIYTTVGKGTFVSKPPIKEEIQPLSGFTEDMARRGIKASSRLLGTNIENANDDQAKWLKIPKGAEVVTISRLRLADGFPLAIQYNWLPHHLCQGLLSYDLAERSLYSILRDDLQLKLSCADTSIRAALATQQECRLLNISPPVALLISEQTTYLTNGAVIEYVRTYFRGDQYTLFTSFGS
jgi:GntR family transcriptional regulator